jgi:hypothetical protein
VERLCRAVALAPDKDARAAGLPLLARAAGALGNGALFDLVLRETDDLLSRVEHTSLGSAPIGKLRCPVWCRPDRAVIYAVLYGFG